MFLVIRRFHPDLQNRISFSIFQPGHVIQKNLFKTSMSLVVHLKLFFCRKKKQDSRKKQDTHTVDELYFSPQKNWHLKMTSNRWGENKSLKNPGPPPGSNRIFRFPILSPGHRTQNWVVYLDPSPPPQTTKKGQASSYGSEACRSKKGEVFNDPSRFNFQQPKDWPNKNILKVWEGLFDIIP